MNSTASKYSFIACTWLWLAAFALAPLLLVLATSLTPHSIQNYHTLLNKTYLLIFLRSFLFAALCALMCLLIAYPFALFISQVKSRFKNLLLLLIIIPFWTSSLIRTYAIMTLLKSHGIINHLLISLGIIHHPIQILYSNAAVMIGLVYDLLPFMILPLYLNFQKLDYRLIEAAQDLGASRLQILSNIIIPLSLPGITAGLIFVFLPAATLFYIPNLLGGAKSLLLGNLIEALFLQFNNWSLGSATSIILLLAMVPLLLLHRVVQEKK